jgi:hypothetical protein
MRASLLSWALLLLPWMAVTALFPDEARELREEVREMFYHTYDNYMEHAFPLDELKPLSCSGKVCAISMHLFCRSQYRREQHRYKWLLNFDWLYSGNTPRFNATRVISKRDRRWFGSDKENAGTRQASSSPSRPRRVVVSAANCEPPPGPKHEEASIILLSFMWFEFNFQGWLG